ncbi:MAG: hypothetical protein JSW34_12340 [Candidatus Zixiibacteriota bacterium]|nr:MAG: hypothetical protein JSW34_12340 [candidate division Zixibacteria bacterium]
MTSLWLTASLLILAFTGLPILAQSPDMSSQQDATQPPCTDCHACSTPTTADPCLEMCLWTHDRETRVHSPSEGPDVAILSGLERLYQPVRFDHKHHAEMVGMGEGCGICHHYSTDAKYPPCKTCHANEPTEAQTLRQPGLRGAYHRQCMGCHREWSHDTKCVLCHLPANGATLASASADGTDILGTPHPVITAPEKKVWRTPYDAGPVVTFHHQEHIDLFGLRCVNCHQQENCSYCHDYQKEKRVAKTDEEIHAICNDCHANDPCARCHGHSEKPAFSHAANGGWVLNQYHQELNCRSCHPTGRPIGHLSNRCVDCHAGWNQTNFRHVVTGLRLDDLHGELDCGDCHMNQAYNRIPKCSACHDDCRNHEDGPPGEYVKPLSSG